jgi:hypothetical protein
MTAPFHFATLLQVETVYHMIKKLGKRMKN